LKLLSHALPLIVMTTLLPLAASSVEAQETYTVTLGVLGGLGGSIDADPGDDLSNQTVQLTASLITEPQTHLGIRLGRINLDQSDPIGTLTDAQLTYVNIAGEYIYSRSFYESGIYFGLGGYQLEGNSVLSAASRKDTAVGLVLGLTGRFEISQHFLVMVDIAGHWANLDEEQIFATGLIGLGFRF
jgi:hypothetical protein